MTLPQSERRIAPTSPSLVRVSGSDATTFLNDLISQRIDDLESGHARRSFLLSPQGKLAHLFWAVRREEVVDLLVEDRSGDDLASDLSRYLIRVDVTLEVIPTVIEVQSSTGPDVSWALLPRSLPELENEEGEPLLLSDYEHYRISSGEPKWGVDVGPDTMPHETGLVPVAVDFTKGCYLGQELVARVDSRGGSAPRRLCRVSIIEGDFGPGTIVEYEGKRVGQLTSVSQNLGLGLIHRNVPDEATVSFDSGSARVESAHPIMASR